MAGLSVPLTHPYLTPEALRVTPRRLLVGTIYFLMGCLSVPVGGIAYIVLVHGGMTPMVRFPPEPSVFHMFSVVFLFAALRLTLRSRMGGPMAMAAGFVTLALTEPRLEAAFPHLWMKIYELVNYLC